MFQLFQIFLTAFPFSENLLNFLAWISFLSKWFFIASKSLVFSLNRFVYYQNRLTLHFPAKTNNSSIFHFQVNNLDKLSHLVCNECVRKIENFHCYALMAHKNQELFNIMYSEKIYREHCTALSSLNTTLYREPPVTPHPIPQPAQSKSPNTITIQPSPPIKKQKMQSPPQKPIKLPPTTVITPAPTSTAQQQTQQVR